MIVGKITILYSFEEMNIFEDPTFRDVLSVVIQVIEPRSVHLLMRLNTNIRRIMLNGNLPFRDIIHQKKVELFIEQCTRKGHVSGLDQLVQSISTFDKQISNQMFDRYIWEPDDHLFDVVLVQISKIMSTRPEYYYFVVFVLGWFKFTSDSVNCSLFEAALQSKHDKFIHFVLNQPLFDPKFNNFDPIRLTLRYKNILVFNLLTKDLVIPDLELTNLVKHTTFTFKQRKPTITIEYFDPDQYKSLSIEVLVSYMINLSSRTDFYDTKKIKIPFPVQTHIMKPIKKCLRKGFNFACLHKHCKSPTDLYSMLRLIEFLGLEIV